MSFLVACRRKGLRSPSSLSSLVTPSPTSSFTDEDEHVIQHCFHYTGTVLTSTLAFQKEQKLKCECQVSACLELFLGTSASPRRLSTRVICLCYLGQWLHCS